MTHTYYMENYSQANQDLFVVEQTNHKKNGTFLDIAAGDPIFINNTYLLEKEYGWTGISVEIDSKYTEAWNTKRKTKYLNQDALQLDYETLLKEIAVDGNIDYLSLDLEPPSLTFDVLKKLPLDKFTFSVVTYEHDCYRQDVGDKFRNASREIFNHYDYVMIKGDVANDVYVYEDWYVHKKLLNNKI